MHKALSILRPLGKYRVTLFELGLGPIRIHWFKEQDDSKRYLTVWWKSKCYMILPARLEFDIGEANW